MADVMIPNYNLIPYFQEGDFQNIVGGRPVTVLPSGQKVTLLSSAQTCSPPADNSSQNVCSYQFLTYKHSTGIASQPETLTTTLVTVFFEQALTLQNLKLGIAFQIEAKDASGNPSTQNIQDFDYMFTKPNQDYEIRVFNGDFDDNSTTDYAFAVYTKGDAQHASQFLGALVYYAN